MIYGYIKVSQKKPDLNHFFFYIRRTADMLLTFYWEFQIFNYSLIFFKEKKSGMFIFKNFNAINRMSG